MEIKDLLSLYKNDKVVNKIGAVFAEPAVNQLSFTGIIGSQISFTFAAIAQLSKRNLLIITNDREEAMYLLTDL